MVSYPSIDTIDTTEGFVYIAGKYRAKDGTHDYRAYEEIDHNISVARKWAAKLAHNDIPFFCPHLNSAHMEVIAPEVKPDFWYRLDMQILSNAKALFMLPGWEESQGAMAEHEFALKWEMAIFYADGDAALDYLVNWWFEGTRHMGRQKEGFSNSVY